MSDNIRLSRIKVLKKKQLHNRHSPEGVKAVFFIKLEMNPISD